MYTVYENNVISFFDYVTLSYMYNSFMAKCACCTYFSNNGLDLVLFMMANC